MMSRLTATGLCLSLLFACASDPDASPDGSDTALWQTWVLASPDAVPAPSNGSPDASGVTIPNGGLDRRDDVLGGDWMELAMRFVAARAKDPPAASRAYALVSVAAFDALVSARHGHAIDSHFPPDEGSSNGARRSSRYEQAAVAGAASRVLAFLFPEQSALRLDQLAEQAQPRNGSGQVTPEGAAGLALGRAVADVVVDHARSDGADRRWDGTRPRAAGLWEPPPGSVSPPVQPLAGTWRTWLLPAGDAIRPPPPPVYASPEFVAEARDLIDIQTNLTDEQRDLAHYWEGGEGTPLPPGIWNQITLEYLREHRTSPAQAVRTLALLNTAMADAGVAAWDAKYAYWTPRPENAIRELLDPDWKPLLRTPLFPAYVSGHSTYSAAAATVLAHLFPRDATAFRDLANEAGLSRLSGGIHYRSDHAQGARMGQAIGRLAVARAVDRT